MSLSENQSSQNVPSDRGSQENGHNSTSTSSSSSHSAPHASLQSSTVSTDDVKGPLPIDYGYKPKNPSRPWSGAKFCTPYNYSAQHLNEMDFKWYCAAGVLVYFEQSNNTNSNSSQQTRRTSSDEILVLTGAERSTKRGDVILNFLGGKRELSDNNSSFYTAAREFLEESDATASKELISHFAQIIEEYGIPIWFSTAKYVLYLVPLDKTIPFWQKLMEVANVSLPKQEKEEEEAKQTSQHQVNQHIASWIVTGHRLKAMAFEEQLAKQIEERKQEETTKDRKCFTAMLHLCWLQMSRLCDQGSAKCAAHLPPDFSSTSSLFNLFDLHCECPGHVLGFHSGPSAISQIEKGYRRFVSNRQSVPPVVQASNQSNGQSQLNRQSNQNTSNQDWRQSNHQLDSENYRPRPYHQSNRYDRRDGHDRFDRHPRPAGSEPDNSSHSTAPITRVDNHSRGQSSYNSENHSRSYRQNNRFDRFNRPARPDHDENSSDNTGSTERVYNRWSDNSENRSQYSHQNNRFHRPPQSVDDFSGENRYQNRARTEQVDRGYNHSNNHSYNHRHYQSNYRQNRYNYPPRSADPASDQDTVQRLGEQLNSTKLSSD